MNCGKSCSEAFGPRKPALKSETESELRPPLASLRSLIVRNLIRTADTVSRVVATETPKPNPNRGRHRWVSQLYSENGDPNYCLESTSRRVAPRNPVRCLLASLPLLPLARRGRLRAVCRGQAPNQGVHEQTVCTDRSGEHVLCTWFA